MDSSSIPFDPHDPAQLIKFRLLIAGIFRDLLAAWESSSPKSFEARLAQVWNKGQRAAKKTALVLLNNAHRNTRRFYDDYGGYQDSVPCAEPGEKLGVEGTFQSIRELVIDCLDPEPLRVAICTVREKQPVDWQSLVDWQALPELRRLLDQLPRVSSQISRDRAERITDLRTMPPNSIVFADHPKVPAPPQEWRLLNYLLQQPSYVSAIDDFAEPVWQDHSITVDKGALQAVLKRLRKLFQEMDAPFAIALRNGFVELSRVAGCPVRKIRKSTPRRSKVSKSKRRPKR